MRLHLLQRFKLLGIVFLVLLVGAVYLTYAIFSKKFVDYDRVELSTSSIGLQLPSRADVKIRGEIVGEVLDFDASDDGATVTLGLYPDEVDKIPANVTGAILPKTLFGEKYVSLVVPDEPARDHIEAGDRIERTRIATEVEKVFSDLYPLLTAVDPGDLNMTLNAIATALEGRGEQIGENLATLDSYLKRFNPELPQLIEDLALTAQVSDVYSDVLPEIGQTLRNTIISTGTLEDRATRLNALFDNVTLFSDTTRTFLDDNEQNMIQLGDVSRAQLQVLAKYSPEFPCLLRGIVNAGKRQAEAFRGFTLHIVLETLPRQPRAYDEDDKPRLADDRGPACLHLPNPPWTQANPLRQIPDFNDGIDRPTGKGTSRVAPQYYRDPMATVGTPAEGELIDHLLAPAYGVDAAEVPDVSALLMGPLLHGSKVSLR